MDDEKFYVELIELNKKVDAQVHTFEEKIKNIVDILSKSDYSSDQTIPLDVYRKRQFNQTIELQYSTSRMFSSGEWIYTGLFDWRKITWEDFNSVDNWKEYFFKKELSEKSLKFQEKYWQHILKNSDEVKTAIIVSEELEKLKALKELEDKLKVNILSSIEISPKRNMGFLGAKIVNRLKKSVKRITMQPTIVDFYGNKTNAIKHNILGETYSTVNVDSSNNPINSGYCEAVWQQFPINKSFYFTITKVEFSDGTIVDFDEEDIVRFKDLLSELKIKTYQGEEDNFYVFKVVVGSLLMTGLVVFLINNM